MEPPFVRLDVVINQLQKISDNVKHMGFGGKPLDEVTDENLKSLIKHHKVVLADYYLSDLRVKEELKSKAAVIKAASETRKEKETKEESEKAEAEELR